MDYFENGALFPDRPPRQYGANAVPHIDAGDLNDLQAALVMLYGGGGSRWFVYREDFVSSKHDQTVTGTLPDKLWQAAALGNTRVSLGYPGAAAGTEYYGEAGGLHIVSTGAGPATYDTTVSRDANVSYAYADFAIASRVTLYSPDQLASAYAGFSFRSSAGFTSDLTLAQEYWSVKRLTGANVATTVPIMTGRPYDILMTRRSETLKYYINDIEVYSEPSAGAFEIFPTITCTTDSAATYAVNNPIATIDYISIVSARM